MIVTRMNVMADRLALRGERQLSLFRQGDKQIDRIKAMVNERCGRFTLRSAETLPLADIYRDTANDYDICDIYGKYMERSQGDCNAICGCVYTPYSAPTCDTTKCSQAECEDDAYCQGTYGADFVCNPGTCTCTEFLPVCGDALIELPEECTRHP